MHPIVGCSRQAIWRMEREGTFPKRTKIGTVSVGWLEHEVEAWLADRMANRVEDMGAPQDTALASVGLGVDEDYGGAADCY